MSGEISVIHDINFHSWQDCLPCLLDVPPKWISEQQMKTFGPRPGHLQDMSRKGAALATLLDNDYDNCPVTTIADWRVGCIQWQGGYALCRCRVSSSLRRENYWHPIICVVVLAVFVNDHTIVSVDARCAWAWTSWWCHQLMIPTRSPIPLSPPLLFTKKQTQGWDSR